MGTELTPELLNKMRHVGVKSVTIFAGYTALDLREEDQPTAVRERDQHVLAFDVPDPETGEVVADGGKPLTEALREKLLKAGVTKVDVLLPAGRSESPLIKNTLAKDPTQTEAEALYADLQPAPSRRRAQPRNGAPGDPAAVLQPEALRPRARGPAQDQPPAQAQDRRRTTRS